MIEKMGLMVINGEQWLNNGEQWQNLCFLAAYGDYKNLLIDNGD
jgi:hypothetical protein